MVYSNDPNLATLNAELAVLRVAVLNLIEIIGAQEVVIANLRGDGAREQLRAAGVPTVHVHAMERAQASFLKRLGHRDQP